MPYRLRDGRGESLVETLVALLVAAFAMVMFAGMIFTTNRITKHGQKWNAYINDRAALLEQRKPGDDVHPYNGTISIATQSGGKLMDDKSVTFFVTKYAEEGGEDVIAYVSSGS